MSNIIGKPVVDQLGYISIVLFERGKFNNPILLMDESEFDALVKQVKQDMPEIKKAQKYLGMTIYNNES